MRTGMRMTLLWRYLIILISRLTVVERISPLLVASRLLGLVFTFLLLRLPEIIQFGERLKNMVMLGWSVAVLFYLFLGSCRLFSVLNSGVLFLPCRHIGLVIWVLTTLMLFVALVDCLMLIAWLNLSLWLKMVIWLLLSNI